MKTGKVEYFRKVMESKSTEELAQIWQEKDRSKYSTEALEAARLLVKERGEVGAASQSTPEHSGRPTSLIRCEDCGREVSKRADKCPYCGAPVDRELLTGSSGTVFYIVVGSIILIIILVIIGTLQEEPKQERKELKELKESKGPITVRVGESVRVGEMSYTVNKSWWSDKLSDNPLLNKKPDARFLFIRLSVSNDGNKPKDITAFKLIDSRGREHGTSGKAWRVEDELGSDSLNPGVTKSGIIVFDVNQSENYKLRITGGFGSSEYALVEMYW